LAIIRNMAVKILSLSTVTLLVTLTYLCIQSSILILAPYFSHSFFPTDLFLGSLAFTFLGFFLGFMIRPLGALIFGSIVDRFGRKVSLTYGLLGATAVAFALSLIPDYNSIGLFSSIHNHSTFIGDIFRWNICCWEYNGSRNSS